MGNRYFWGRYTLEKKYGDAYTSQGNMVRVGVNASSSNPSTSDFEIVAMRNKPNPVGNNKWTYSGEYWVASANIDACDEYSYCIVIYRNASSSLISSLFGTSSIPSGRKTGTLNIDFNTMGGNSNSSLIWGGNYIYWSIFTNGKYWILDGQKYTGSGSGYAGEIVLVNSNKLLSLYNYPDDCYDFHRWYTILKYSQGNFIDRVTSNKSNAYPDNNYQGEYWWNYSYGSDYQRYDNIDPISVTIPNEIKGDDSIQITVEPRNKDVVDNTNNWLGTVTQYNYEYSTGDNQWHNIISNTTSTTYQYTVPLGTPTFQVRVRANDTIGFTSTDYVYSSTVTVKNNDPPTAPGRVTASNVYADQVATITITAATDPNGQVVNYEWQRSVDGGAYSTIQTTGADTLSITDNIGADWGTVAYRVRAKDDYGEWGPYATSETYTINENLLTIAAPPYSLGMQTSPFYYTFSIGITGNPVTTNGITAIVYLDNRQIHEETDLERDEAVSVPIDPRLLGASTHTILVVASKEGYTTAEQSSDFYIEGISAPAGGIIEQLQNSAGQAVIPYTLGQAVIGRDGKDINTIIEEVESNSLKIESGSYSGNGTYGSYNPNTLMTSFEAKMMILSDSTGSTTLTWVGSPTVGNITVNSTTSQISWYANSAANQFNTSGQTYYYTIIG